MAHPSFLLKKARNDQFYFVLTAKNGQVIMQSEMHDTKESAKAGINMVRDAAMDAELDDQTDAA